MQEIFQSTLPRRERPNASCRAKSIGYFNPRSRVGSDITAGLMPDTETDFNPRSRVGSDDVVDESGLSIRISIHAPA